ncbi:PRD domain-containing protein [Anaerobacillus sp. MEB173]|uniref:PRD domain-containing protein n=1 Tax=Anaerobacillus sp. MEB173 TaxID=3383345 RepID=UPI003F913F9A
MKINKVLNNNVVVVKDGKLERIVMGSGIAFGKRKNDIVPKDKIEKIFVMKEENERFQELIHKLPEEHITIAEEIITFAEKQLSVKLSNHIHIALTDHLSFAIERIQKGIDIENKLLNEIKILYRKEYDVGLWAKDLIKKRLNIDIPDDEVGHIALHIHTAKEDRNIQTTIKLTTMINEIIEVITKELNISINEQSIFFHQLVNHLRYTVTLLNNCEPSQPMDVEMIDIIKSKYNKAFQVARKVAQFLLSEYNITLPEAEIAFISLHIQRFYEREKCKRI